MVHQGVLKLGGKKKKKKKKFFFFKKKKKKKKKKFISFKKKKKKKKLKKLKTFFLGSFKEKKLPLPLKILTSPKTTPVLLGTLGTLLFPAAAGKIVTGVGKALVPKTVLGAVKAAIVLPVAGGLIATSPTVQTFFKGLFDPRKQFQKGKTLGGLIEDPTKLFPKDATPTGVGKKIKEIATTAGLIAAGGAAVVGAGALLVPAIQKFRERRRGADPVPQTFQQLPFGVIPSGALAEPVGAVQKPTELEKEVPAMPSMPDINIINRPRNIVDIKINQSKRFINQQVLVRG